MPPSPRSATPMLALLLLISSLLAVPPAGHASDGEGARFEPAACAFPIPAGQVEGETLACGYLVVPEDRSAPDSREIRLAVAVFSPPGGASHPDAVVYLEGGPGGSPLRLVGSLRDFDALYAPIVESGRDLVLVDQRGVGLSEPALECPGFSALYLDLFDKQLDVDGPAAGGGERLTGDEIRALKVDELTACAEALRDDADLRAYHTAESAADIEDLRTALGYETLDLWGTSYGSRVALAVMRDYPGSVRSAILDAPLPPDVDLYADAPGSFRRALDEVFAACAAEPACAAAYPDLPDVFTETIVGLDADPVMVELLDPVGGVRVPLLMDGSAFAEQVFRALYQPALRQALPKIVFDARAGRFDTLLPVAQLDVLRQRFRSWGMYWSVLCHEDVPFDSLAAFEAARERDPGVAGMYDHFEIGPLAFEVCREWDAGVAEAAERELPGGDIPTLLMTGQFDPIVPPDWGAHISDRLAAASFFVFPGAAHGASGLPCATEMMLAFLSEPRAELDASCVAETGLAPFDLPVVADVDVELEPFRSDELGLTGLAPVGWRNLGPGAYARARTGTDPVSIVSQVVPLPADETLALLTRQFGLAAPGEALDSREAGGLTWRLYRTAAQGVIIDYALADAGEVTLMAVLTSTADEHGVLYDHVLLPSIDALRRVAVAS